MDDIKFAALQRMKCRARSVVSQGDTTLSLQNHSVHLQQQVVDHAEAQTRLLENIDESTNRIADSFELIARNSTIVIIVGIATLGFLFLRTVTSM